MSITEAIVTGVAGALGKKAIEKATETPPGKKLTRRTKKGRAAKSKSESQVENALARAIAETRRREEGDDPALEEFREELFAEMKKLIPDAIRQAKGSQRKPPRPALLRILTRFGR